MLNETVITQAETRIQAWSLQTLLRFIAALGVLFALGCLYFSQVNAVATIRGETADLQMQAQTLERENVSLMVQVAAWTRPGNVEVKALEQGMVDMPQPAYVALPPADGPAKETGRGAHLVAWWQQLVLAVANRWPVH